MAEEHQNTDGPYPDHTQEMFPCLAQTDRQLEQEILFCPVQADRQLEVDSEADFLQDAVQDTLKAGTVAEAAVTDGEETVEAEVLETTVLALSDLPDLHCYIASQNIFVVLVFPALAEVLAVLWVPQTSRFNLNRVSSSLATLRVKHSM